MQKKNSGTKLSKKCSPDKSHELVKLTRQLELAKKINCDMAKNLEYQALIINKTELAFDTKMELVNAKNEIIKYFKTIVEQNKK